MPDFKHNGISKAKLLWYLRTRPCRKIPNENVLSRASLCLTHQSLSLLERLQIYTCSSAQTRVKQWWFHALEFAWNCLQTDRVYGYWVETGCRKHSQIEPISACQGLLKAATIKYFAIIILILLTIYVIRRDASYFPTHGCNVCSRIAPSARACTMSA
jgi:hypothetical protein